MEQGETKPGQAALIMLVAMVTIGLVDNFVGQLSVHISVWQFLIYRMVFALPILALAAWAGFGDLRARHWGKVLARGGLMSGGMVLYFSALGFIPLGEALAGLFTSPIFILLISVMFFGQRIGLFRILAVAVGFIGVLLVLQPGGAGFSWVVLLPVFGAALYALGNILTRRWCADESTMSMLAATFFMQGVMGIVALGALAVLGVAPGEGTAGFLTRGWQWVPDPAIWPYMAAQVAGSIIGVFCLIRAYQIGEASYVTVFEYSVMVFGPCFAFFLFDQALGLAQIGGIALIVLAGVTIALRARE